MSHLADPFLDISGLSVRLGRRQVIDGLSCAIGRGELVGLIGPNGSGKTTLLRAIMGLVACGGTIRLGGADLRAMPETARAKLLAYLPQDGEVVWPMAVADLVMLGRAPHRSGFAPPSPADKAAVERALAAMDLTGFETRFARELSGGERARVLIARALAQDTPVLVADEPTAGLDPSHQIALMETFRAMAQQGRTVLASLHELAIAAQWCDRLVLLDRGRIAAMGAPSDVLTEQTLSAVYGIEAFFGASRAGPVIVPIARIGQRDGSGPNGR